MSEEEDKRRVIIERAEEMKDKVGAPTLLDGSPVDKEEAARVHAGLVSGEMSVTLGPGVAEQLEAMGMTVEEITASLIAASKKTMN